MPVPPALLSVFDVNDTMREKHELHMLNTGLNVIMCVYIIESRLLRVSGPGMLKKQNNEKMHKTQMVMFPWNRLDWKLQIWCTEGKGFKYLQMLNVSDPADPYAAQAFQIMRSSDFQWRLEPANTWSSSVVLCGCCWGWQENVFPSTGMLQSALFCCLSVLAERDH